MLQPTSTPISFLHTLILTLFKLFFLCFYFNYNFGNFHPVVHVDIAFMKQHSKNTQGEVSKMHLVVHL